MAEDGRDILTAQVRFFPGAPGFRMTVGTGGGRAGLNRPLALGAEEG